MYSLHVVSQDESKPVIDRTMSANRVADLIPVVIAICEKEFHWLNAVAIYMGDNVYRIFDLDHPNQYAKVTILDRCN